MPTISLFSSAVMSKRVSKLYPWTQEFGVLGKCLFPSPLARAELEAYNLTWSDLVQRSFEELNSHKEIQTLHCLKFSVLRHEKNFLICSKLGACLEMFLKSITKLTLV